MVQVSLNTMINFLDIIHRPNLAQKSRFFTGGRRQSPVSETSFQIKIRTMDNVQKIYHFIHLSSSRTFRSYLPVHFEVLETYSVEMIYDDGNLHNY
jgi:hypothetical protein